MTATSSGAVSFADFFIPGDKILEDTSRQILHNHVFTDGEITDLRHQISRTKYGVTYLQALWQRISTQAPPTNLQWIAAIDGILGGTLASRIKLPFSQALQVSRQFCEFSLDAPKYYEEAMNHWIEKTVQMLLQELIAGHIDQLAEEIRQYQGKNEDLIKWCQQICIGREKGIGQISFYLCLGLFRRWHESKNASELAEQIEELAVNCSLADLKMEPNFGTIVQLPVKPREQFLEFVLPRLKAPNHN